MTMSYVSTRGGQSGLSLKSAVMSGMAIDGGLLVPAEIPTLDSDRIKALAANSTYADLASFILREFDDDEGFDWPGVTSKVYNKERFPYDRFGDESTDVVSLKRVDEEIYIAGLSNGRTLAFKDVALQLVGELYEIFLSQSGGVLNILGATSGDTGSAAIHAMLGHERIRTFMLSPRKGMTPFQEGQMWGVDDPNVFNIAIKGSFDDCQKVMKDVSADLEFKEEFSIGSVNSVNWARIAAQVVYYFWSYYRYCDASSSLIGREVDFVVPTGNFGNVYAGYVAREMGLPIRKLVLTTNENDILHEFFCTGVYRPRSEKVFTISPSMDIQVSSNFERFVHHQLDGDADKVKHLWESLRVVGEFSLSGLLDSWRRERSAPIESYRVGQAQCFSAMKTTYALSNMVVDPHTAVGMYAALERRGERFPTIVLETAQPCKFKKAVTEGIGRAEPTPQGFELPISNNKFVEMEPDADQVKDFIRANAA